MILLLEYAAMSNYLKMSLYVYIYIFPLNIISRSVEKYLSRLKHM